MKIIIDIPSKFIEMGIDRDYTKSQIEEAYRFYVEDTLEQLSREDMYDVNELYNNILDWVEVNWDSFED